MAGPAQAAGGWVVTDLGHRSTKDVIRQALHPEGRRILDIGCGAGALVAWLRREGASAIGIEPNVPLLRAAIARRPGPWIAARAEQLPLADGSIDAAIFFNSLHHVVEPALRPALADAARVLRPGGTLLVIEPLASGSFFELLRPLDDETAVRAAALAAIDAAALGQLIPVERVRYRTALDYANVEAVVAAFTRADPGRAAAVDHALPAIAERFATLGRPQADGSRRFDQPMLALRLRRIHVIREFIRDNSTIK